MMLRQCARENNFISRMRTQPQMAALCRFCPGQNFFPQQH
jgi:hypothetical protein